LADVFTEDALHTPLKDGACILQTERHGGIEEAAERSDERRGELIV
jgi:hypothetical protein